jgi:hypothetical protein
VTDEEISFPREREQHADFFCLDTAADTTMKGEYRLFATEGDERVESRVLPGFWLHPVWLWQAGSLDPWLILCEMAGLSETVVDQFRERLRAGFER